MAIQLLVQNNSGVVSVKKLQFYENVSDDFFKQTIKLYHILTDKIKHFPKRLRLKERTIFYGFRKT